MGLCPPPPPPPMEGSPPGPHTAARPGGGGGLWHAALDLLFLSAAGGAYWPIAIRCPSLGPVPSIGSGDPRPVPFLSPLGLSVPLYFPFLSLGRLCQRSPPPFPTGGGGGVTSHNHMTDVVIVTSPANNNDWLACHPPSGMALDPIERNKKNTHMTVGRTVHNSDLGHFQPSSTDSPVLGSPRSSASHNVSPMCQRPPHILPLRGCFSAATS